MEAYVPLKDRDDLGELYARVVPEVLRERGLDEAEVEELAPLYVERFLALDRKIEESEW